MWVGLAAKYDLSRKELLGIRTSHRQGIVTGARQGRDRYVILSDAQPAVSKHVVGMLEARFSDSFPDGYMSMACGFHPTSLCAKTTQLGKVSSSTLDQSTPRISRSLMTHVPKAGCLYTEYVALFVCRGGGARMSSAPCYSMNANRYCVTPASKHASLYPQSEPFTRCRLNHQHLGQIVLAKYSDIYTTTPSSPSQ